jgi:hypothetical protein
MPTGNQFKSKVLQGVVVRPTPKFPLNKSGEAIHALGGKSAVIKGSRPPKNTPSPNKESSGSLSAAADAMDLLELAVKLFNSKKYPTLSNIEDRREQVISGERPEFLSDNFSPDFNTLKVASKIASNPSPFGIATAILGELIDYDMMGRVEKQIKNLEDIQMWEEQRNKEISLAMQSGIDAIQTQLESQMKVLNSGLEKQMESKIQVLTGKQLKVSKLQMGDLNYYSFIENSISSSKVKKLSNTERLNKILGNITNFVSNGNVKYKGTYLGVRVFETKFCENGNAITLPPLGIFITPNQSEKEILDTLRHEHGHILQSYLLGIAGFYIFIGVPSLVSTQIATVHQESYTEKIANQLEYWYLGKPADWNDKRYLLYFK